MHAKRCHHHSGARTRRARGTGGRPAAHGSIPAFVGCACAVDTTGRVSGRGAQRSGGRKGNKAKIMREGESGKRGARRGVSFGLTCVVSGGGSGVSVALQQADVGDTEVPFSFRVRAKLALDCCLWHVRALTRHNNSLVLHASAQTQLPLH